MSVQHRQVGNYVDEHLNTHLTGSKSLCVVQTDIGPYIRDVTDWYLARMNKRIEAMVISWEIYWPLSVSSWALFFVKRYDEWRPVVVTIPTHYIRSTKHCFTYPQNLPSDSPAHFAAFHPSYLDAYKAKFTLTLYKCAEWNAISVAPVWKARTPIIHGILQTDETSGPLLSLSPPLHCRHHYRRYN